MMLHRLLWTVMAAVAGILPLAPGQGFLEQTFQQGVSGGSAGVTAACTIRDDGGEGLTTRAPTLSLGTARGLLGWPELIGAGVDQVPIGASILEARLELFVVAMPGAAPSRILAVNPVLDFSGHGPWVAPAVPVTDGVRVGASWLRRDARNIRDPAPWALSGGEFLANTPPFSATVNLTSAAVGTWVTVDVAAALVAYVNGIANQGWTLIDDQIGADLELAGPDHPIAANRPRLYVKWMPPTAPPYNHPPVVPDQTLATTQGATAFILLPELDGDGTPLLYKVREQPANGVLNGFGAPYWSYRPATGFVGTDSFTVFGFDGVASSRLARITINVTADGAAQTLALQDGLGGAGDVCRSTTVVVSNVATNQQTVEATLLQVAPNRASFVDFPGLFTPAGSGTSIPLGADIVSATLRLNVVSLGGTDSGRVVTAARITDPLGLGTWFEPSGNVTGIGVGVSWGSRDARPGQQKPWLVPGADRATDSSASIVVDGNAAGLPFAFDVTAAVQAWSAGAVNQGWVLTCPTGTVVRFASDSSASAALRPRLDVVWRPAGASAPNLPPRADAGSDRLVREHQLVELDASGTFDPEGQPLVLVWIQTAGPSVTAPPALNQATVSFLTPTVPADTTLRFVLAAYDGITIDIDEVAISIVKAAIPNGPPVADAGPAQVVVEGSNSTLSSLASFDPEGAALTRTWSQLLGPSVSVPAGNLPTVNLLAPILVATPTASLVFRLSVSDGTTTSFDSVVVTVNDLPNQPPIAHAGPNQGALSGWWVGLDARQSTDPNAGQPLQFSWSQTAGPAVTLQDATTPVPWFRAPSVAGPTNLVFEVTVSDGVLSAMASTTVAVTPAVSSFIGAQDLLPYRDQLTIEEAQHLLRRAAFDPSAAEVAPVLALGLQGSIADLLSISPEPQLELNARSHLPPPLAGDQYPQASVFAAQQWWLYLMMNTTQPFRERMAYLWNNWTCAAGDVAGQQERHWIMMYTDMFRQAPLPSFRTHMINVTRAPLMLDFLDGFRNRANAINENYAREFMELHALGIFNGQGNPNYSENDVQEAARAFTGWRRVLSGSSFTAVFSPNEHDNGLKTIFGVTSNFDDIGMIDLTLGRSDAREFVARKLFTYFVHATPSPAIVTELMNDLLVNNWQIAPVVAKILGSNAMFSGLARKAQVKTPMDLVVGTVRATGLQISRQDAQVWLSALDHDLMNVPSPKGFPEGIPWLSAGGALFRAQAMNDIATDRAFQGAVDLLPLLPPAGLRSGAGSVANLGRILAIDIEDAQFRILVDYMNQRTDGVALTPQLFNGDSAADRDMKLRGLVYALTQHPDFQRK